MPSRAATVALFVAAGVAATTHAEAQPKPFALSNLIEPMPDQTDPLKIYVSTTGTAPPKSDLENVSNWRLAIATKEGSRLVVLDAVRWEEETNTAMVSLIFQRKHTYGVDLNAAGWRVVYLGDQLLSAAIKAPSAGTFKAAKGKEDAAVYAFGS